MTFTSLRKSTRHSVSLALIAALLATTFTAITWVATPTPASAAPSGSQFDPEFIISDENFYGRGTMTVAQIQKFLNEKGKNCTTNCLKDYRGDIQAQPANPSRCKSSLSGKTNVTAARIIYDVSQACHIKPEVILVTMQKEMSLVTMNNPQDWRYNRAMGFACPDTAPCDTKFAGFNNQLYFGAGQFNRYGDPNGPFTWIPFGGSGFRDVAYHPTRTSCGTKRLYIKNRATAALYYYTPYLPNKAALDNLYGLGDSCSSYGNRNFWRLYHDWFGDPTVVSPSLTSSSVWRASDGSGTFLIDGDQRWLFEDESLVKDFAPLGSPVTASTSVLGNYSLAGVVSRVVENPNGRHFLIDEGKRHRFEDCDQVEDFGFSCADAAQLSGDLLGEIPWERPDLSNYVTSNTGVDFYVNDGVRREVLDQLSLEDAGFSPTTKTKLSRSFVTGMERSAPIARTGVHIRNRSGSDSTYVLTEDGSVTEIHRFIRNQTDLDAWLGSPSLTLTAFSLELLEQRQFPGIFTDDGQAYALHPNGRVRITDPDQWLPTAPPALSATMLDAIPTVDGELTTPALVYNNRQDSYSYVHNRKVWTLTTSQANQAAAMMGISPKQNVIAGYSLRDIPRGSGNPTFSGDSATPGTVPSDPMPAPTAPSSSVWRASDGSGTFLIDGDQRWLFEDESLVKDFAPLGSPVTVSPSVIGNYSLAGPVSRVVENPNGRHFFIDDGSRHRFEDCDQVEDFGFSCADAVQLSGDSLGLIPWQSPDLSNYVTSNTGVDFYVVDGVRREVLDQLSLEEAGFSPTTKTKLSRRFVTGMERVEPIARTDVHIRNRTGSDSTYVITDDGSVTRIDPFIRKQTDFDQWLGSPVLTLTAFSLELLEQRQFPGIFTDDGQAYALHPDGRVRIADPEQWIAEYPVVSATMLDAIPTVDGELSTPALIYNNRNGRYFYVDNQQVWTLTTSQRDAAAAMLGIDPQQNILAGYSLREIPNGTGNPNFENSGTN